MSISSVGVGRAAPLGASLCSGGVNFSVFSKNATRIELLLFDDAAATHFHLSYAFVLSVDSGKIDPALVFRHLQVTNVGGLTRKTSE